jgi:hypothetical protein
VGVKNTYPRDALLHLLSAIALYWSAGSMLTLLFAYVNVWVPDPLEPYASAAGAINWPLAMLTIIFPVYLWSVWFLNRDLARYPEKNEYKIRRWLLYLNVFLAGALLIGDMVALIYGFLSGGLSARFLLKVLAVFAVGAAVFAYYLFDLRRQAGYASKLRFWGWGAAAAVLAVIIAGVSLAGSPFRQRLLRFDERKVGDLQNIQWQVVNFWQNKKRLPADLAELRDPISGFAAPRDPQTGAAYEYRRTGELSFELCAEFNLRSEKGRGAAPLIYPDYGAGEGSWEHGEGRVCFTRTIDPERYPPTSVQPKGTKL